MQSKSDQSVEHKNGWILPCFLSRNPFPTLLGCSLPTKWMFVLSPWIVLLAFKFEPSYGHVLVTSLKWTSILPYWYDLQNIVSRENLRTMLSIGMQEVTAKR